MKKKSQQRRERDRKADDPWPGHRNRDEAQDPSTSRNSKRVEAWRGDDRKGKFTGRRGRKRKKQAQRVERQKRVNEKEINEEMQKRLALIAKIRPVITRLCSRSTNGVVVPYDCLDHDMIILKEMYSPDGWVRDGLVDVDEVVIGEIVPWTEFSCYALKKIRKKRFRPFREKNILEILADIPAD